MPCRPSFGFACRGPCRPQAKSRHAYRAGSLERVTLDINRRHDVAGNKKLIFKNAARAVLTWAVRHEFGDWFAVFCDDDRGTRARDFIHQGEAPSLELGGFDVAGHADTTIVRTMVVYPSARLASRFPVRTSPKIIAISNRSSGRPYLRLRGRPSHPTSTLRNCHGSVGSMFSGNRPGRPVNGV